MAFPAFAQDLVATQPLNESQSSIAAIAERAHVDLPNSPGSLLSTSGVAISNTSANLPEAADPQSSSQAQAPTVAASTPRHAAHLAMTVQPGEIAAPMTPHEKFVGGLKDSVSLFSVTGWLAAAGWEQLTNGSPNYGTDSGAFGQRLGAAAIRGTTEGILTDSVFAPLFHEDPRYYIMGSGHNFIKRAIYAGTRVIITRTDSGRTTPNFAALAGNAAGAALTVTYYPSQNTSLKEVAETWGGSLGGSALGYVVDEFIVDALVELHIKKRHP